MAARDDIGLMQLADGELDKREAAQLEEQLERDPDARNTVEALSQMSELVRSHLELAADDVPSRRFDAMWRAVDKELSASPQATSVQATSVWSRIIGWLDRHRGHMVTGALSAGAVAALALMLRPGTPEVITRVNTAIDVRPVAMRAAPEIESLDTPGGTGTVINLEDEDGHAAVIWVTAADTVEGI